MVSPGAPPGRSTLAAQFGVRCFSTALDFEDGHPVLGDTRQRAVLQNRAQCRKSKAVEKHRTPQKGKADLSRDKILGECDAVLPSPPRILACFQRGNLSARS